MNPKSHTLFHFTKNSENLKLILKNGFWPRYCAEDVRWLSYDEYDFIGYPMVCFCDIPLSRTGEHVKFYGEYGIGMSKEWAESNGITPILYVSNNSNIPKSFRILVENAFLLEENKRKDAIQTVRYFLAHSKPTNGNVVVGSELVSKEFYQESEWRYVPKNENIVDFLNKKDIENEKKIKESNLLTKQHCIIDFGLKDIKYIFVKNDSDIPDIVNFIQTELDQYPSIDIKILLTRVTSLESISRDL